MLIHLAILYLKPGLNASFQMYMIRNYFTNFIYMSFHLKITKLTQNDIFSKEKLSNDLLKLNCSKLQEKLNYVPFL